MAEAVATAEDDKTSARSAGIPLKLVILIVGGTLLLGLGGTTVRGKEVRVKRIEGEGFRRFYLYLFYPYPSTSVLTLLLIPLPHTPTNVMAKKVKHEEHENHERWLVSYADFITLLFAFFVVMYSISSVNEGKFRTVSESIQAALRPVTSPPAGRIRFDLGA